MGSSKKETATTPPPPGEQIDFALRGAGSAPDVKIRTYLLFHSASLVVNKVVDNHLSQWGLSVPRYAVLRGLLRQRSMTMVELSRYLMCNASNANSVVGRLVRDGLVKRESNPLDGRSTNVKLTAKGNKIAQEVIEPHRHFLRELMTGMSEEELHQFASSIEGLIVKAGELSAEARTSEDAAAPVRRASTARKAARTSRKLEASS